MKWDTCYSWLVSGQVSFANWHRQGRSKGVEYSFQRDKFIYLEYTCRIIDDLKSEIIQGNDEKEY